MVRKSKRQTFEISANDLSSASKCGTAGCIGYNNGSIVRNSLIRKSFFLLFVITTIWFFHNEQPKQVTDTLEYCIDPDDSIELRQQIMERRVCKCPDPKIAARRPEPDTTIWNKYHEVMVQDVKASVHTDNKLDFVLIGDSITERWNGTRSIGRGPAPEFRYVFEQYFDQTRNKNAPLNGLAFGAAGDISVELLWHLQNGIITSTLDNKNEETYGLNPRVWIVLIGTNDIGRSGCSKRTVLAGILQVINYVHKQRPDVPIIVHGLLPRSDVYHADPTDYSLGRMWEMIQWINKELKKFCDLHKNWNFLDVNELFLQPIPDDDKNHDDDSHDKTFPFQINSTLMEDALHPSVKGYELWAPELMKEIQKLL